MCDVGSALVVAWAFDLTDDDEAVRLERFAMQTKTTSGEALAGAAEYDAGG